MLEARALADARAAGIAHVNPVGLLVALAGLVLLALWVRQVWREGPHATG